jgi:hypothetical protein
VTGQPRLRNLDSAVAASASVIESSPERSTKQRSRASQSGLVEIFEHIGRTGRPLPAAHVDVGG